MYFLFDDYDGDMEYLCHGSMELVTAMATERARETDGECCLYVMENIVSWSYPDPEEWEG